VLATVNESLEQPVADCDVVKVKLPPEFSNFFEEGGYTAAYYNECRSNARLRVRKEAMISSIFVPPFAGRPRRSWRVLVKDISRTGVSVLNHEQLWPSETFSLELHGRMLTARVVRCRKLGPLCYECGAVLMTIESAT
jgi:hypothetical protein